jgi:hypothetical protein
MRADRADRRPGRTAANQYGVAGRNYTPGRFASLGVYVERLVVHALVNLEASYRFGGISGFVNISRHAAVYSRMPGPACCFGRSPVHELQKTEIGSQIGNNLGDRAIYL